MTREEIYNRVKDLLVDMFELKETDISMDARLVQDLDLDSIDAIDMVVKLQELTGKRVEEEALRKVRTVKDIVDLVESYIGSK